jgi:electron transfer flavoprotein beta subunit
MMAKKKPITVMDLAALGTSYDEVRGAGLKSEIVEFIPQQERKGGQKFEGDAAEITARVVDLLANEAKVL